MIETIDIRNFRCFESVSLSQCKQINIVVGDNASGKSALLEALFLASGNTPEIVLRMRGWRGDHGIFLDAERSTYEAIWKDLFHKFDKGSMVSIQFSDLHGVGRKLEIQYPPSETLAFPLGQDISVLRPIAPIVFNYTDENDVKHSVQPIVSKGQLLIGSAPIPALSATIFPTQIPLSSKHYAILYSDLSKQKRHVEIIQEMKALFPLIEDISVEIGSDGQGSLYVAIQGLPEKIPIGLFSSGAYKMLCLLLSIYSESNRFILIDEVENGFYFRKFTAIWDKILHLALKYNVQVFATTHSYECLQALVETVKDKEDNFSLIRTKVESGIYKVEQFRGHTFFVALEQYGEIR